MSKSSDATSLERKLSWLPTDKMPEEVASAYDTFRGAIEHLHEAWQEYETATEAVPQAEREDVRAATDALSQGGKPPKRTVETAEKRLALAGPRLEAARTLANKAARDLERAAMNAWPTWRRTLIDESIPELEERTRQAFQALREAFDTQEDAYRRVRLFDAEASKHKQHKPSFDEHVDTYVMPARQAVKGSSKPSRRADGTHLPRPHSSRTPQHALTSLEDYLTDGRDGYYLSRWAPLGDPARAAIQAKLEAERNNNG